MVWILPFTSATTESAPGPVAGACACGVQAEPATAVAPAAPKVFRNLRRDVPSRWFVSLMMFPRVVFWF